MSFEALKALNSADTGVAVLIAAAMLEMWRDRTPHAHPSAQVLHAHWFRYALAAMKSCGVLAICLHLVSSYRREEWTSDPTPVAIIGPYLAPPLMQDVAIFAACIVIVWRACIKDGTTLHAVLHGRWFAAIAGALMAWPFGSAFLRLFWTIGA